MEWCQCDAAGPLTIHRQAPSQKNRPPNAAWPSAAPARRRSCSREEVARTPPPATADIHNWRQRPRHAYTGVGGTGPRLVLPVRRFSGAAVIVIGVAVQAEQLLG
jgi:hypothetical protein